MAAVLGATLLLATGAAFAQTPSLPTDALPTVDPTPITNVVDDILDGAPDPRDPTGVVPPGTDVVTEPLKDLLPPGVITDPDPGNGGNGGGGSGGGRGTGGGGTGTTTGTTSGGIGDAFRNGAGSGSSITDSTSGASGAARLGSAQAPFSLDVAVGRAMRLAVPMAAPIGVAVAGVLGLVMLAKSNGRLDGLDNEKEALGGWTVIRL